ASNVPGLRDAVVDGSTGLLVEYGDAGALATAISSLLSAPRVRRAMGETGHVWASHHGWAPAARLFLRSLTEPRTGHSDELEMSGNPARAEIVRAAGRSSQAD